MKHLKFILIVSLVSVLFPASLAQAQERKQGDIDEEDITTMEFDIGSQGLMQNRNQVDTEIIDINSESDPALEDSELEMGNQRNREELLIGIDGNEGQKNKGEVQGLSEQTVARRSRVANSVQEMLRVAERNEGVGTQIREIAQAQNRIQEEADTALNQAQERKGFVNFLIGSDNSNLNIAAEKLIKHQEKIEELEIVKDELENETDREILTQQIGIMEQVSSEIEKEVTGERQGFSLFGWVSILFSKRNQKI